MINNNELTENDRKALDELTKMSYESYGNATCAIAKARLEKEPWFRGICVDTLKDSYQSGLSVERAAEILIDDTIVYDRF